MCVQETKWKGSKARELGNGFKLFYIGEDGRKNGVGIILNDVMKLKECCQLNEDRTESSG